MIRQFHVFYVLLRLAILTLCLKGRGSREIHLELFLRKTWCLLRIVLVLRILLGRKILSVYQIIQECWSKRSRRRKREPFLKNKISWRNCSLIKELRQNLIRLWKISKIFEEKYDWYTSSCLWFTKNQNHLQLCCFPLFSQLFSPLFSCFSSPCFFLCFYLSFSSSFRCRLWNQIIRLLLR